MNGQVNKTELLPFGHQPSSLFNEQVKVLITVILHGAWRHKVSYKWRKGLCHFHDARNARREWNRNSNHIDG